MVTKNFHQTLLIVGLLILTLLISGTQPAFAGVDDPAYHRYEEILPALMELYEEHPDRVRIDTIGYSQQDKLPIFACYITANVEDDETNRFKPWVVINGSVHAEEVLGIEYSLWLAKKMLTHRSGRYWLRAVNTYIIPCTNVEGITVVYSLDNTWRKNKRDNVGDGLFRWKPGWGGDSSGVDINRNFPTFWNHGTDLFVISGNEFYDYYRGPAPASESETRALIEVMDKYRPLYATTIHSSRTGNVAEQVIYPFAWGKTDTKFPPDKDFLDEYANQIALRCKKYGNPNEHYKTVRVGHARGDAESYYYYKYGSFGCRVEIGQKEEGMQPDSAGMYQIFDDVTFGFEWMLNSAAGIRQDEVGEIITSRFDIQVTDAVTGDPLYARLVMDSRVSPLIPAKYTNPNTGFYFWMVGPTFTDTLRVSRFGYEPWKNIVRGSQNPSYIGGLNGIQLDPLPWHEVRFNITDGTSGLPIEDEVEFIIEHPDTAWAKTIMNGQMLVDLPEGDYRVTLTHGTSHVPRVLDISITDDVTTQTHNVGLSPANILLAEDFDGTDIVYTSDNNMNTNANDSLARWDLARDLYHSAPRCLTDTRVGFTPIYEEGWAAPYDIYTQSFDLTDVSNAALTYWLNQALEPGHDSMWVEFSIGGDNTDPDSWEWVQAIPAHDKLAILNWREMDEYVNRPWNANKINLMNYHDWEHIVVSVPDEFIGEDNVHFRFRLSTDGFVEEDGVYIDDVFLLASGDTPPAVSSDPVLPKKFTLGNPYPNPFNGQLSVRAHLPANDNLKIRLFDLNGRLALDAIDADYKAGSHTVSINAGHLPSGLYMLQAVAADRQVSRKVMLLK